MAGRRRSDRALRDKLRSPGRPGMARREDRLRFWALIAAGLSSEDAAIGAGVSPPVGTRWFREAGGMPSSTFAPSSKPLSGRYLAFAEREEIALALAQDFGVREIARRLGRAASTVSRELGLWSARDRPPTWSSCIDRLARIEAQRGDAKRRSRVSG